MTTTRNDPLDHLKRLGPTGLGDLGAEIASDLSADAELMREIELALGYPLCPRTPIEPWIRTEVLTRIERLHLASDEADSVAQRVIEDLEWAAVERITDISKLDPIIAERSANRSSGKVVRLNRRISTPPSEVQP